MCGLVGIINKNPNGFYGAHLDIMEQLLFMDTLRGDDSTGVFLVNNIGNVGIAKDVGTGGDFIKTQEWNTLRTHAIKGGWAMIGHNRKATRGSVNDKNAHPFWVDDSLVLVHNGSYVGDHKALADTEVDSEAIAQHLAKNKDDIQGALQKVNAAYALIWYDVDGKKVHVACNGQRPLHFAESQDCYYISSEAEILEFVLKRNNRANLTVYSLNTKGLHTFQLTDDKRTKNTYEEMDISYKYPFRQETKSNYVHHASYHGALWENEEMYDYSCAYGHSYNAANDFIDRVKQTDFSQATKQVVERKEEPKNIWEDSKQLPTYPHYRKFTCDEFEKLKEAYKDSQKVTVLVEDYVETDIEKGNVIVTGRTLDNNSVPVFFKMDFGVLANITDDNTDDVVFEITIDGKNWRRTDPVSVPHTDAKGSMWIRGKEPVLKFNGNVGVGHA